MQKCLQRGEGSGPNGKPSCDNKTNLDNKSSLDNKNGLNNMISLDNKSSLDNKTIFNNKASFDSKSILNSIPSPNIYCRKPKSLCIIRMQDKGSIQNTASLIC